MTVTPLSFDALNSNNVTKSVYTQKKSFFLQITDVPYTPQVVNMSDLSNWQIVGLLLSTDQNGD